MKSLFVLLKKADSCFVALGLIMKAKEIYSRVKM